MTSTFDSTGLSMDRYSDIKADEISQAELVFGTGIDTSSDELFGHQIDQIAILQGDSNEKLQAVYDSTDISNSTGIRTANLIELIGLTRSASAFSTATLSLTNTKSDGTTIPAGSRYGTTAGVVFETDINLVFASATTLTVAATATEVGALTAAIGEIDQILSPVFGISTVDNLAAAIPGRLQETSAEMKVRHTVATATSGEQDTASVFEALTAVTGVSFVRVVANDTSATVDGVPAYNLSCVVVGGTDADVGSAIANNKVSTVPTFGAESVVVYNSVTSQAKTINFGRALELVTYVSIALTKTEGVYPDDGDDTIKNGIIAYYSTLNVGDDVDYEALYRPIYAVAGVKVGPGNLTIGTSPGPADVVDIPVTNLQYATITAVNIVITP